MGVHYLILCIFSDLPEIQVYNPLTKTLGIKYISECRLVIAYGI